MQKQLKECRDLDIVGMDVDNIYKTMGSITNAISDACEPTIRPDIAMQTVKDKTVIVVEIFPGAERPYYIKSQGMIEGTYVRVAGTTRHVEDYMLKELILEGKKRYFDSEICQNMKISDSETKNVLISWGDFERKRWKRISNQCLCASDRTDVSAASYSMWCIQGN